MGIKQLHYLENPYNPDSTVTTTEDIAKHFFDDGVTLASLVDTINQVGATTSDLVAILEALKRLEP